MNKLLYFFCCLLISQAIFAGVGAGSLVENIVDVNIVEVSSSAFLDRAPIYDKEVCRLDMLFDLTINGLEVEFKNKAVGEYSSVEWTFGDGTVEESKDVVHKYKRSGIYYFTVMIHDPLTGCIDFIGGNYYLQSNNNLSLPQKLTHEEINKSQILNLNN